MSNTNEQQAFPMACHLSQSILPGMTLRDYFAAKAMQGMFCHDTSFVKEWQDQAARDAYAMADAMLKAREA